MKTRSRTSQPLLSARLRDRSLALLLGTGLAALFVAGVAGEMLVYTYGQLKLDWIRAGAEQQRQVILGDLASGDTATWSGRYGLGGGFERDALDLSSAGFFFEYDHCTGTGHLAHGQIEDLGAGRIRLVPEREVRGSDFGRSMLAGVEELISIRWGDQRLIVPANEMEVFCRRAISEHGSASVLASYMHVGGSDWSFSRALPKLPGLPEVPVEYRHLLDR